MTLNQSLHQSMHEDPFIHLHRWIITGSIDRCLALYNTYQMWKSPAMFVLYGMYIRATEVVKLYYLRLYGPKHELRTSYDK